MAFVTNSDLLTYILANRFHYEDGQYLLQEKAETMGEDAIGSARSWLYGRFFQAGETEIYDAFIAVLYAGLVPASLTTLEGIRAAIQVITGDTALTSMYTMIFESLIRLSVAYIWKAAGMDGEAKSEEKLAQEFITAIVGAHANPGNVIGGEDGSQNDAALGSTVVVYPITDAEVTTLLNGYE